MRTSSLSAALLVAVVPVVLAGCGGSPAPSATTAAASSTSSASAASHSSTSSSSGAVNPNARETLPPGDIPDTIAYVPYTSRSLGLTISTPEGWSRSSAHGHLVFTDKLNRVDVFATRPVGTLTPAAVRARELPTIRASVRTFALQSVTVVARRAGTATRIAYLGDSAPNPVTGKIGTLAFERYEFRDGHREIVVLVSSPRGSDNVDPWRIITNSLRFAR